jgi:hypothetical protein
MFLCPARVCVSPHAKQVVVVIVPIQQANGVSYRYVIIGVPVRNRDWEIGKYTRHGSQMYYYSSTGRLSAAAARMDLTNVGSLRQAVA